MDGTKQFNVFVGAETGLLKGVNVQKKSWCNLNSLGSAVKENEITSMCWGNAGQSTICLALRSRTVVEFGLHNDDLSVLDYMQEGEGHFVGLSKYNETMVTCTNKGVLKAWSESPTTVDMKADVKKMCQSPFESHVFATGGEEHDLKLWDLNKPEEPVFRAKNVKNDFLNLRVPVCVMTMGFFHDQTVAVGTGHHQVRVYDPRQSQRRPVFDMEYDEYPITALSVRPGTKQVIVGNSKGNMATLDLRMKGSLVSAYKGVDGSIRGIQCHATKDLVVSCGLDRFLRVHDINTRKLVNRFYLKSRLNCLLFSDHWEEEEEEAEAEAKGDALTAQRTNGHESDMDVWETMEQVGKLDKKEEEEEEVEDEEEVVAEEEEEEEEKVTAKKNPPKKRKKQMQKQETSSEEEEEEKPRKRSKPTKSKKSKKKASSLES